jgi:CHAT domain-containing protein
LADQRPITIVPSVTVFAQLAALGGRSTREDVSLDWIGFGDPLYPSRNQSNGTAGDPSTEPVRGRALSRLPGTRQELSAIAALFGDSGSAVLGGSATEGAVRRLAPTVPLVHFACHGLIDQRFPLESALALSPEGEPRVEDDVADLEPGDDGYLQAWEVLEGLRLNADCVTLSACETGAGEILDGEGVMGFTRAFFHAGARSVVVSLWPISDQSTAVLMERFYRELTAGASRDVALQRAQRQLIDSESWDHPFFWAAFQLHGRWD